MMKNECSIRIKELTKDFGEKRVLNNIQLDIFKGEIFGLLGPSGAGKTTLIKVLTAQIKANAGEAELMGKNVKNADTSFYQNYGMVLDNVGLYERLTCMDNLLLFAGIYNLPKSKATEVLKKVGLADAAKRPAERLSKGMRQRLTLARALMHQPEILFLDEPTSGLDPSTAMEIRELIREQKNRGATVFLTTHNMEEASSLCDHVGLLFDGRIVEYGEPDAICRKYNGQNIIKILLKNNQSITLQNDSGAADEISRYLKEEQIVSIHSSEPNLETVFMQLTGKGLSAS